MLRDYYRKAYNTVSMGCLEIILKNSHIFHKRRLKSENALNSCLAGLSMSGLVLDGTRVGLLGVRFAF